MKLPSPATKRSWPKGSLASSELFAPTKKQSRIVRNYLCGAIFDTDLLRNEVSEETKQGFQLTNGNLIDILTGDFRTARGHTLLAAIVDEAAFFGIDDEAKVKSDAELMRAIKPSLATAGGRLIAISSPYARRDGASRRTPRTSATRPARPLW